MITGPLIVAYILEFIVGVLVKSNDFFLLSHQWIISPSVPNDTLWTQSLPSATACSLIYGILEPLLLRFFLWLEIAPWMILIVSSMTYTYAYVVIKYGSRSIFAKRGPLPLEKMDKTLAEIRLQLRVVASVLIAAPLLSAVSLNALLLMFYQSFSPKIGVPDPNNYLALVLTGAAILFYALAFPLNIEVSKSMLKAQFVSLRSGDGDLRRKQFENLFILTLSKMVMRLILRCDILIAFKPPGSSSLSLLLSPQQSPWLPCSNPMRADLPAEIYNLCKGT